MIVQIIDAIGDDGYIGDQSISIETINLDSDLDKLVKKIGIYQLLNCLLSSGNEKEVAPLLHNYGYFKQSDFKQVDEKYFVPDDLKVCIANYSYTLEQYVRGYMNNGEPKAFYLKVSQEVAKKLSPKEYKKLQDLLAAKNNKNKQNEDKKEQRKIDRAKKLLKDKGIIS